MSSNNNNASTDSEIQETEARLARLREKKQREEEERKRVEEERRKAKEERLRKEEAERKKAEAKARKAEEKRARAEEARKKKEREDELKKAKAGKAKAKDSEESGSEESGDDEGEAKEEEVVGDKRKRSANQDCASCLKKEIECVWPASGSKKQKSCDACHVAKIKCFVGEKPAKKARSNKTENKKKADKAPEATFVELGGQDGALDSITESFRSMAEDIKGIRGLLRAHYDLGKATLNAHKNGYSIIADEIYHFRVVMGYRRAESAEQEGEQEEEGEIMEKGDNAEGSAKDNRVDGSQTMAE
jgi:hypothetical protein